MTDPGAPILHGTVVESAVIAAPLVTVWAAFAEPEFRGSWFAMPGPSASRTHELDFRVGGSEVACSTFPNVDAVERLEYRSRFIAIEDRRRITTVYEFRLNDILRFASLLTIEFTAEGGGTRVDYTEQYQFFGVIGDGSAEVGERGGGTRMLLRRLAIAVERAVAEA